MPAHALPSILPAMTVVDALEVIKIYSVRGLLPPDDTARKASSHESSMTT
jgi:predicted ATPase with chaperone activity